MGVQLHAKALFFLPLFPPSFFPPSLDSEYVEPIIEAVTLLIMDKVRRVRVGSILPIPYALFIL